MIELSRTKTTPLGIIGGRKKFAVHASIAPLMMRNASNLSWEEINPSFAIEGTKRVSVGTPYRLEVDDQGDRIIYPDRTDRSKYIHLPTTPLFRNLAKTWETSTVTAQSSKYSVQFGLQGTRTSFKVLFQQAPAFSEIKLNCEAVGYDINSLLSLTIPKPRLTDAKGLERLLEWKYIAGQLVLGLDFSGMTFPVLLQNSTLVDVDVGATADDGQCTPTLSQIYPASSSYNFGGISTYPTHAWARFDNISWDAGCTIDAGAVVNFICYASASGTTVNMNVYCDNNSDPGPPTTVSDPEDPNNFNAILGRLTTQVAAWSAIPAWTGGSTYTTPSITAVLQELVDDNGAYVNQAVQVILKDNSSTANALRNAIDYSYDPTKVANLYFSWSAGGGGAAYIPKVFFF